MRINKLDSTQTNTVSYYHVNDTNQLSEKDKNHFVIAIINTQEKTFTSWGMSEAMHEKTKAAYDEALVVKLSGSMHKVRKTRTYPLNVC